MIYCHDCFLCLAGTAAKVLDQKKLTGKWKD